MKKVLLCLAIIICIVLIIIACNKLFNKPNVNDIDSPIDSYETPDFTEKAGFKVDLGDVLSNEATYDSILLMNDTVAQLDLVFTDNTIGTLLVDTNASTDLEDAEDAIVVGNTKVSIQKDDIGVNIYTWVKDDFVLSFYTNEDLRDSERLSHLVNDVSIEV